MKKHFSFIILILLISCQKTDWKDDLKNDLSDYTKSEKIKKSYSIKHESGNDIHLKLYKTSSNGFAKLTAEYKRKELGDWNKTFFLKNDKVIYSKDYGIAPIHRLEDDNRTEPKYFLIEKISFFKNDSIGFQKIKELELSDLNNIESKTTELNNMDFIISELNNKNYKLCELDYKLLTE